MHQPPKERACDVGGGVGIVGQFESVLHLAVHHGESEFGAILAVFADVGIVALLQHLNLRVFNVDAYVVNGKVVATSAGSLIVDGDVKV